MYFIDLKNSIYHSFLVTVRTNFVVQDAKACAQLGHCGIK